MSRRQKRPSDELHIFSVSDLDFHFLSCQGNSFSTSFFTLLYTLPGNRYGIHPEQIIRLFHSHSHTVSSYTYMLFQVSISTNQCVDCTVKKKPSSEPSNYFLKRKEVVKPKLLPFQVLFFVICINVVSNVF